MRFVSADQIRRVPFAALIEALRDAFRGQFVAPPRSLFALDGSAGESNLFAVMPAWDADSTLGAKLATLFPGNPGEGRPTIHALVVLFDRSTGRPTAVLDGTELTRRRTAAASALAAGYLARSDSYRLLIVGTGPQALNQALAHCAVRPIKSISVWGRDGRKADQMVTRLRELVPDAAIAARYDLAAAARDADIISCATSSAQPLLLGAWLRPGTHVDLVGAFSPRKREADSELIRNCRLFADVTENVLAEAGDVLIPLEEGVIARESIVGDLHDLTRGRVSGRERPTETTVFKSVGTAMEDLASAACVVAQLLPA